MLYDFINLIFLITKIQNYLFIILQTLDQKVLQKIMKKNVIMYSKLYVDTILSTKIVYMYYANIKQAYIFTSICLST